MWRVIQKVILSVERAWALKDLKKGVQILLDAWTQSTKGEGFACFSFACLLLISLFKDSSSR
jgi:hypothetical protein